MQRDVEDESTRARERRGEAADLVVLLDDERLESLPGERRAAREPREAGADDDAVERAVLGRLGRPPGQRAPVERHDRIRARQGLEEVAPRKLVVTHRILLRKAGFRRPGRSPS